MEHRIFHDAAIAQMFNDDSLEECRRDTGIPDAFGIHDDDRAAGADAKARRFTTLHAPGTEEQPFALQ